MKQQNSCVSIKAENLLQICEDFLKDLEHRRLKYREKQIENRMKLRKFPFFWKFYSREEAEEYADSPDYYGEVKHKHLASWWETRAKELIVSANESLISGDGSVYVDCEILYELKV